MTAEKAILVDLRRHWKLNTASHEQSCRFGTMTSLRSHRRDHHAHIRALVAALRIVREARRDKEVLPTHMHVLRQPLESTAEASSAAMGA